MLRIENELVGTRDRRRGRDVFPFADGAEAAAAPDDVRLRPSCVSAAAAGIARSATARPSVARSTIACGSSRAAADSWHSS